MENNSIKRLSGMIGLAMRAGRLTLGADMVCLAMQKKSKSSPKLIILAHGASAATRERIIKKSAYYGVPLIEVPIDMGKLGQLLGKTYAPAVISVNDEGFAKEIASISKLCTESDTESDMASEQILRKDAADTNGGGD